jgi:hypothetical protein
MNRYDHFFKSSEDDQFGGSGFGPVLKVRYHRQNGHGLGQVFKSLWSILSPYLISSGKAIGSEALKSGSEILSKLGSQPVRELVKRQSEESLKALLRKTENKLKSMRDQSGEGINRKRIKLDNTINSLFAVKLRPAKKRSRKVAKKTAKNSKQKRLRTPRTRDIFNK